jgi:hypothetical protein
MSSTPSDLPGCCVFRIQQSTDEDTPHHVTVYIDTPFKWNCVDDVMYVWPYGAEMVQMCIVGIWDADGTLCHGWTPICSAVTYAMRDGDGDWLTEDDHIQSAIVALKAALTSIAIRFGKFKSVHFADAPDTELVEQLQEDFPGVLVNWINDDEQVCPKKLGSSNN